MPVGIKLFVRVKGGLAAEGEGIEEMGREYRRCRIEEGEREKVNCIVSPGSLSLSLSLSLCIYVYMFLCMHGCMDRCMNGCMYR